MFGCEQVIPGGNVDQGQNVLADIEIMFEVSSAGGGAVVLSCIFYSLCVVWKIERCQSQSPGI